MSVGTTGSARELIGAVLGANVVKNEITAHAVGHALALSRRAHDLRDRRAGQQDHHRARRRAGRLRDEHALRGRYRLVPSSQARRLGVAVEDFGEYAMRASKPTKIAGRCTVFAESDLVHKAQMGHPTEDLVAGPVQCDRHQLPEQRGQGKRDRRAGGVPGRGQQERGRRALVPRAHGTRRGRRR